MAKAACRGNLISPVVAGSLAVFILATLPMVTLGREAQSAGGDKPMTRGAASPDPKVQLSVNVEATANDDVVVVVVLTNVGESCVRVDRDLVFLLNVIGLTGDGTSSPPRENDAIDLPTPKPAEVKKRFVKLKPGGSVTRRIDLVRGFKVFTFGTGSDVVGDNGVSGYETTAYYPRDQIPARLMIDYGVGHGFREAFKVYTNLESVSLDLYEGPLSKTVVLPKTGAASPQSNEEGGDP